MPSPPPPERPLTDRDVDVVIVGGGPAGLTAAIYLARFRLTAAVIDAGRSRALLIPCTRNHAGFPGGIAGRELLWRMQAQAVEYGAAIHRTRAHSISGASGAFDIGTEDGGYRGRAVLLATGVVNLRPQMDDALHDRAVAEGRLRYCPVCDGYEVTDQKVGVIGSGEHGASEAEFIRAYTADVCMISPTAQMDLEPEVSARLKALGIEYCAGPATDFVLEPEGISLACADGRRTFQSIYAAMGSRIPSELAAALGADLSEDGCILVDQHQRTNVKGLYAAGDVVRGLDQISHAMGAAGVAATAIRNDLARISPLVR